MMTLLFFGFLIGMRHAIEADHVAAVASLTTKANSMQSAITQGAVWGLGHTLTLFLVGTIVLLLDTLIPEQVASLLEFIVGIMLVLLGIDVLRRLYKDRIHFHLHEHQNGEKHFHAHSHKNETGHDPKHHEHEHKQPFPYRALFVGLMHGLAGSAALLLLTLDTVPSITTGIVYISLFGIGSIFGMALLSIVIAAPLRYSATNLTWLHHSLQFTIGAATIVIGSLLIHEVGIIQSLFPDFLQHFYCIY